MQTGRPTLREIEEPGDVFVVDVRTELGEELTGLAPGEAQVVVAKLEQLALDPQPANRNRWVASRADDQTHAGGERADERGERLRRRAGKVEVVEHDRQVGRQRTRFCEPGGEVDGLAAILVEAFESVAGGAVDAAVDGHRQGGPEANGVDVGRVTRQPGGGPGALGDPRSEYR